MHLYLVNPKRDYLPKQIGPKIALVGLHTMVRPLAYVAPGSFHIFCNQLANALPFYNTHNRLGFEKDPMLATPWLFGFSFLMPYVLHVILASFQPVIISPLPLFSLPLPQLVPCPILSSFFYPFVI